MEEGEMWKWCCNWVMGRDLKSLEVRVTKSPDCIKESISRNRDVEGNSGEDSKTKRTVEKVSIILDIHISSQREC